MSLDPLKKTEFVEKGGVVLGAIIYALRAGHGPVLPPENAIELGRKFAHKVAEDYPDVVSDLLNT